MARTYKELQKLNTVLNQTNNSQKIKNKLQINVSNYNGNANENHVETLSHPVRMIDRKVTMTLDMVVHTFNRSTWKVDVDEFQSDLVKIVSSRSAKLHSETLSQKPTNQSNKPSKQKFW